MPLNIDDDLIQELVKRQVEEQQMQERFAPRADAPSPEQTTMSPDKALLLGGMADAASTYSFLKRGTGREDNAVLNNLLGGQAQQALPTAAAAFGTTMGALLLKKLIAKASPKVADTLAGGLGGYQLTLAGGNINATPGVSASDLLDLDRINTRTEPRLLPSWKHRIR